MDGLPGSLAYGCLDLLSLVGREELVDVDQVLWVNLVSQVVVACEDTNVTVVD